MLHCLLIAAGLITWTVIILVLAFYIAAFISRTIRQWLIVLPVVEFKPGYTGFFKTPCWYMWMVFTLAWNQFRYVFLNKSEVWYSRGADNNLVCTHNVF